MIADYILLKRPQKRQEPFRRTEESKVEFSPAWSHLTR